MIYCRNSRAQGGFTLLEILIVIAIIAVVIAIAVPAMSAARREGRATVCGTKLRELGGALQMYADDFEGRFMPLAYWATEQIGTGPVVYWWGTNDAAGVDHERGFLWPYLRARPDAGSIFECPQQTWGTYRPQGAAKSVTSTYGYNGYYLSSPQVPGYSMTQIGHIPWLTQSRVADPSQVFSMADTLIDLGGATPFNNAFLEPPQHFDNGNWGDNWNPTTAFRHDRRAEALHLDGHVEAYRAKSGWLTSQRFGIGSIEARNDPHYVPNWRDWPPPP